MQLDRNFASRRSLVVMELESEKEGYRRCVPGEVTLPSELGDGQVIGERLIGGVDVNEGEDELVLFVCNCQRKEGFQCDDL
jgi:hypothetical protein